MSDDDVLARARAQAGMPVFVPGLRDGVVPPVRIRDLVSTIRVQADLPVVHLPFERLDARLGGGLEINSLTLIVSGSGKGKTSLALQIGAHHAETSPLVYYVGEMTPARVASRVVGQRTGRRWRDVTRGQVSDEEMHAVLDRLHVDIVPRQAKPLDGIRYALDQLAGVPGTPMLIVDYVQLLADVATDQRLSVMEAVRGLRELVESRPIVCVALSQSSRGSANQMRKGTENAEELIGVGAETAELELSASNVLALAYTSADDAPVHDVTVAIAKCRDGGPGKLGMRYDGRTGVWSETATTPLSPDESLRREAILHHIGVHAAGRCLGGRDTCGQDLSSNAFTAGRGTPHHVQGARGTVLKTVKAMEREGIIFRDGNTWRRRN